MNTQNSFRRHFTFAGMTAALLALLVCPAAHAAGPALPNPILFVTQMPVPQDFTTIGSVFGNHSGAPDSCGRGGDLWIRYGDGTLRNLTRAAGFGGTGLQTTNGIAVREPCVHWNGTKAIFSMVVGAPVAQFDYATESYWQLYEITGFGVGETPVITKVPNQPASYNNVSPIYGTDDRILFTSDRPRDGRRHLYPQLDEYEEAPTVTGLWSLDPVTGDLFLLNHAPSGVFSPGVDSFGRVTFVRWDHLQRDQQADTDAGANPVGTAYGTFNYATELFGAAALTNNRAETFPETRAGGGNLNAHNFNHFFPWQINEDGTEEETLNHIGRHELGGSYRMNSFNDDTNLHELYYFGDKYNTNTINNLLQLRESAATPGFYYGIDAPEFATHAAGQIVRLEGPPTLNPDLMRLDYVTPRATAGFTATPPPDHTGLYRSPQQLSDGTLIAVHTPQTDSDTNLGTTEQPRSRYDFRLKTLQPAGGFQQPGQFLTPGLSNTLSFYSPDSLVSYSGQLWELDPVEVRPRPRPARLTSHLPPIEQKVFADEGVDLGVFRTYLRLHNLALIVSRNVTARDKGDQQQPYNLRVPGGTETLGAGGKIYDLAHFQLYQADLIRGIGLRDTNSSPRDGRRALAQRLHDPLVDNPPNVAGPPASVPIAPDGSMAAFVPARRALSWQTTDPVGTPVVRERYWLTFQPGEIRTCFACHGINTTDQANRPAPTNAPAALRSLLQHWKTQNVPHLDTVTNNAARHLTLTFKRNFAASNLTHVVESSTNLTAWIPGSTYTGSNSTPATAETTELTRTGVGIETITVRDNTPSDTAPKRFLRVRIQGP